MFFQGTAEEFAAHQAAMREIGDQIAGLLNQLEEMGSSVGMNAGTIVFGAGTIAKRGGPWQVLTGR